MESMKWMARSRWIAPILALMLYAGAAPAATEDTVVLRRLAGSWTAVSMEFQSRVSLGERHDLVAALGASGRLELQEGGAYALVLDLAVLAPERVEGRVDAASGTLRVQDDLVFRISVEADRLVLTCETARFDFDESGREVPARLRLVFERG
jgi:hypothetical protein